MCVGGGAGGDVRTVYCVLVQCTIYGVWCMVCCVLYMVYCVLCACVGREGTVREGTVREVGRWVGVLQECSNVLRTIHVCAPG